MAPLPCGVLLYQLELVSLLELLVIEAILAHSIDERAILYISLSLRNLFMQNLSLLRPLVAELWAF